MQQQVISSIFGWISVVLLCLLLAVKPLGRLEKNHFMVKTFNHSIYPWENHFKQRWFSNGYYKFSCFIFLAYSKPYEKNIKKILVAYSSNTESNTFHYSDDTYYCCNYIEAKLHRSKAS